MVNSIHDKVELGAVILGTFCSVPVSQSWCRSRWSSVGSSFLPWIARKVASWLYSWTDFLVLFLWWFFLQCSIVFFFLWEKIHFPPTVFHSGFYLLCVIHSLIKFINLFSFRLVFFIWIKKKKSCLLQHCSDFFLSF